MRGFLTFSLIVLSTIASVKSFCADVSHNSCRDFNQDPDFLSRETCQKLCSNFASEGQCEFYRYAEEFPGKTDCYHYGESLSEYTDGCDEISAPRNIDAQCFNPPADSCYMTQSSSCRQKLGNQLEDLPVDTQKNCQDLCNVNPNCQRWIYYKEKKRCTTLSDATQECKEVFGPPNKSPTDCGQPDLTTLTPGTTITAEFCTADTIEIIADEDNCMKYFTCVEGNLAAQSCPDCDYYDRVSQYCKQPINGEVVCDTRPYDNNCKATTQDGDCPFDYGYFPVTGNCKDYKICDNGVAQYQTCATQTDVNGVVQQLLYNGDQVQCDWTYRVTCGTRPVCDSAGNCQCQDSVPGADPNNPCRGVSGIMIIADPFNCQNKFICRDGTQLDKVVCPEYQYYEIRSDSCKSDEAVCNQNDQYRPICVDGGSGSKQQCRCVDD